jgi:hypothetical protein
MAIASLRASKVLEVLALGAFSAAFVAGCGGDASDEGEESSPGTGSAASVSGGTGGEDAAGGTTQVATGGSGGTSQVATGGSGGAPDPTGGTGGTPEATGGTGSQPTPAQARFLGGWEKVSSSVDGTTCPLKDDENPDDQDPFQPTSDGNLTMVIMMGDEPCLVPLTIEGDVASGTPGYSCPASNGSSSLVFHELTFELTSDTTARVIWDAEMLVLDEPYCIWSMVTDLKKSN